MNVSSLLPGDVYRSLCWIAMISKQRFFDIGNLCPFLHNTILFDFELMGHDKKDKTHISMKVSLADDKQHPFLGFIPVNKSEAEQQITFRHRISLEKM